MYENAEELILPEKSTDSELSLEEHSDEEDTTDVTSSISLKKNNYEAAKLARNSIVAKFNKGPKHSAAHPGQIYSDSMSNLGFFYRAFDFSADQVDERILWDDRMNNHPYQAIEKPDDFEDPPEQNYLKQEQHARSSNNSNKLLKSERPENL